MAIDTRLDRLTVREAAEKLRSGETSAVELTEVVLNRIRAVDQVLHAFETIMAEDAVAMAEQADREIASDSYRGPLHGVPVVLKDIIDTAGTRTTASSRLWADRTPSSDAAVVARLREAGAVLAGKTVTHEFAFGVVTPQTCNPWNVGRICGGSSGGSAAAVAADACIAALGTDTGGSIRIPAANCGIVGAQGTYGLVSKRGVAPLSWSLDCVGPMTKTVEDAAVLMHAIAGPDPQDPASLNEPAPDFLVQLDSGAAGLRVGVPLDYFFDDIQPEIENAVRDAIGVLASLGADIVEVRVPGIEYAHAIQYGILSPEAASFHLREIREHGDLYASDVRALLEAGQFVPATHYVNAQRLRRAIKESFRNCYEQNQLDVLVVPTLPSPPSLVGELSGGLPDVRLTCPFNLSGQPVLGLPCGFTADGMPIGMQIAARPLQEPVMFRIAHAYESATDWHTRSPQVLDSDV